MADSKVSKVPEVLYRVPKSISRVPNEVWEAVRSNLPYLSSHALRRSLGYKATSAEDNHSRIWSYFFKSEDWLNAVYDKGVNPCLIGYDLYPLLHDKHSAFNVTEKYDSGKTPKRLYLALVFGRDQSNAPAPSGLQTNEMRELLYKCLQPFETTLKNDIVFANGFKLNVSDIVQPTHYANVTAPRQLVSRKLNGLHSAYLYWKDTTFRVWDIKPKDVFGIGKGVTKKNVSQIVGLNWIHLPSGMVRQHVFNIVGMMLQTNAVRNNGNITRFEWRPKWEIFAEGKGLRSNVLASVKKEYAENERLWKARERRDGQY